MTSFEVEVVIVLLQQMQPAYMWFLHSRRYFDKHWPYSGVINLIICNPSGICCVVSIYVIVSTYKHACSLHWVSHYSPSVCFQPVVVTGELVMYYRQKIWSSGADKLCSILIILQLYILAKKLEIAMADRCRADNGSALWSCQMYNILLQ